MIIRDATTEDFDRLCVLSENFYKLTQYQSIGFCHDSARRWLARMLEHELLIVAESDGVVVGVVGGLSAPHLMNDKYGVGQEMFWWVEPEHRGGRAATGLLRAIEQRARDQGLIYWSMICLEAVNPDKVSAFYERHGYTRTERAFTKEL